MKVRSITFFIAAIIRIPPGITMLRFQLRMAGQTSLGAQRKVKAAAAKPTRAKIGFSIIS
jgi:hypothetical protein